VYARPSNRPTQERVSYPLLVSGEKYANRYVCHLTDNKSSGVQSSLAIGGLSVHPGKSTPLLLYETATKRLMPNSENVDSLSECDGIWQRNRARFF
jgi:hypothetical protein